MEGEARHESDRRIIDATGNGDEIFLFFRKKHHQPFTYFGSVYLLNYEQSDGPNLSRFRLNTVRTAILAASSLQTEHITHGEIDADSVPDEEGRKQYRRHMVAERSKKNRAAAIAIHGTVCKVCGFDFDRVYGADFARSYIEIHHIKPLADNEGPVDLTTDLVPLCSNCHSMAHRQSGTVLAIQDLLTLVQRHRK